MIRMRNFKARNERIETGGLVKSHEGRKVSVERRVGEREGVKKNGEEKGQLCNKRGSALALYEQ